MIERLEEAVRWIPSDISVEPALPALRVGFGEGVWDCQVRWEGRMWTVVE
jgi:hypothetical protein